MHHNFIAGRGVSSNHNNRYSQQHYVATPWEVPEEENQNLKTKFLQVYPKTLVNQVTSPDIPFGWSMNPYQGCEHGCAYCYARPTHEYWGYNSGLDFESKLLVKTNAPVLFKELLTSKSWKGEPILLSGNTDPYQPLEKKMEITKRLLEIALDYRQPVSIITKNSLILRDLELLEALNKHQLIQVAITITTLQEDLRRKLEPRTATSAKRLETVKALSEMGIPTTVMMAPIIPALNSHEIFSIAEASSQAGARRMGYTSLRLNNGMDRIFGEWLKQHYPDRLSRITHLTMQLHGGKVSNNQFGARMKGKGTLADQIKQQITLANKRYFTNAALPVLSSKMYRKQPVEQLDLFTF